MYMGGKLAGLGVSVGEDSADGWESRSTAGAFRCCVRCRIRAVRLLLTSMQKSVITTETIAIAAIINTWEEATFCTGKTVCETYRESAIGDSVPRGGRSIFWLVIERHFWKSASSRMTGKRFGRRKLFWFLFVFQKQKQTQTLYSCLYLFPEKKKKWYDLQIVLLFSMCVYNIEGEGEEEKCWKYNSQSEKCSNASRKRMGESWEDY